MTTDVTVPTLGESVTEATVAKWFKAPGEAVTADEPLVELETDKVTVEVNAPVSGTLGEIVAADGADVEVGALLARIKEGEAPAADAAPAKEEPKAEAAAPAPEPAKEAPKAEPAKAAPVPAKPAAAPTNMVLAPAVRKMVEDNGLDASVIPATGPGGRLTKGDVASFLRGPIPVPQAKAASTTPAELPARADDPREERVKMTKLRRTISQRLKDAQNTAAMLTTWNDVDMSAAMAMRSRYKDKFEKKHGVRLGFMSIFVRAAVIALKEWPAVNAELYGDELIYKNYYNVGVAVGSPTGLVVPVLRDVDDMSFSEIEGAIAAYGAKARDGKLTMDDMMGGTFTISNGGVFGSMMSMPILNAPQSAILGMHRIDKRPVADGDNVVIKPMMYLALTYDHRVIDGREAVSFLVRIKECVEDPERLLIEV